MRICGKRASQFTQTELWLMQKYGVANGEKLTDKQIKEIKKVYKMREVMETDGTDVQRRV